MCVCMYALEEGWVDGIPLLQGVCVYVYVCAGGGVGGWVRVVCREAEAI